MVDRALLAVATALVLAVAGPVSVASAAKVKGPKRVSIGERVTFRASGFPSGRRLDVVLQPTINRGGNAFGYRVTKRFRVNRRGRARIRFRWPRRYYGCSGSSDCRFRYPWKRGSKVDVNVCEIHTSCARRVVRIRRR